MTTTDVASTRLPWDAADPYPFYEARARQGDVVWDDTAQAWLVLELRRRARGPRRSRAGPATHWPTRLRGPRLIRSAAILRRRPCCSPTAPAIPAARLRCVTCSPARSSPNLPQASRRSPVGHRRARAASRSTSCPRSRCHYRSRSSASWLDLEPATAALLRELSPAIIRMLGALADPDEIAAGAAAGAALMAEFLPLAADRRAHPGDDLLSFIAADPDSGTRRGRR